MINLPEPISAVGPEIDLPLLRKVVDLATAEAAKPDQAQSEWDQTYWFRKGATSGRTCGTTGCIAGHVVMQAGGKPIWWNESRDLTSLAAMPDGREVHAANEAQALLGLTQDESSALFWALNSIKDVRTAAERIAARAGERL